MISNMVINRWNNKFLKILVFICLPIFICGCKDDRDDFNYSKTGKETTVSFSVRVPGAETPKTYALDEFGISKFSNENGWELIPYNDLFQAKCARS